MRTTTWLITGASRGFGREFARAALGRGDNVVATARDISALQGLRGEHPGLLAVSLDVTDAGAVRDRVAQAEEHFGPLDVVVNNAGYGHFGAVEEVTDAELRDQLEVNVLGAHRVARAALPGMRERGSGHIVQVSSIGGVMAVPNMGAYHASKWALEALSESLAAEVARFGVHVTLVEPGGYDTDWAGSSARHSDPVPAYDTMREEMSARRGATVPGDPAAAARALLEIVDAAEPPLRVLFGALFGVPVTEIARGIYDRRLKEWTAWEDLAEVGTGPLVLLVHGFPESWYSWRRQLTALAAAGYRAVAIDVRGYGRSSKPGDTRAYRMLDLVADNAAVVRALGGGPAVIIGHDWGAVIAANSALLRPELFRAVGLLSVPYTPRAGPRPGELFARMGGDEEFYVSYFQQPGRAEAEIEPDVRGWLAGFFAALSAGTMPGPGAPDPHFVGKGGTLRDRFPAGILPGWLSEGDLDVYAGEFERTGLTGALNRYRNMDRDWEDLAGLDGAPLTQPSLFIGGSLDASTTWLAGAIDAFPARLPGLAAAHILDGCGHWTQQERPAEVNRLLTDWLASLPA